MLHLAIMKGSECYVVPEQAILAAKKIQQQDRIRNQLLALPPMSRIKLRVTAGVFEVTLLRVIEENNAVEVLWDRGLKREFKWRSVVFGETDAVVGHKPTEPAVEQDGKSDRSIVGPNLGTESGICPRCIICADTHECDSYRTYVLPSLPLSCFAGTLALELANATCKLEYSDSDIRIPSSWSGTAISTRPRVSTPSESSLCSAARLSATNFYLSIRAWQLDVPVPWSRLSKWQPATLPREFDTVVSCIILSIDFLQPISV